MHYVRLVIRIVTFLFSPIFHLLVGCFVIISYAEGGKLRFHAPIGALVQDYSAINLYKFETWKNTDLR